MIQVGLIDSFNKYLLWAYLPGTVLGTLMQHEPDTFSVLINLDSPLLLQQNMLFLLFLL
jgi:hypothetical protein